MFRRILLWFAGMLLFSFVGYMLTSWWFTQRREPRQDFFRRTFDYLSAEAVTAYENGGPAALREVLARQRQHFIGSHHLLDASGRDLATNEDRSKSLAEVRERRPFRITPPRRILIAHRLQGGKYTFLIDADIAPDPLSNLLVYLWIVAVIVLLCYALATQFANPVKQLHEMVLRFGRGDLTSRTRSRRKDEIGALARAFDDMADRIETLLTAERRLLQDVSHELRSPLARLRFALQLARTSRDPIAAFARVDKEVDRLTTLVADLLHVTRAEGDPGSRNVSNIALPEFLSSMVEEVRIEADARGCKLNLNSPASLTYAGDPELLRRAIENIVRNAIHHAPNGTAVDVDLIDAGTEAIIRVRDYGQGVPDEQLSQIFRPFYRVEEDRNRSDGGVGLGLAIAERAVLAHNGEVRACNASPGLLVEIHLPK